MIRRIAAFAFGVACYAVFFATLLYAIGFLGNFGVPKSMDSGPEGSMAAALLIDGTLLAAFAIQHSVMARPWFKRTWTRFVPDPVERSMYVIFSSLALIQMFWLWQPIGGVIWRINGTGAAVIYGLYAAGLLIVLLSTFLINHFRPVRIASGLPVFERKTILASGVSHAVLLSIPTPSALCRLAIDLLVCAGHDGRAPVLCGYDYRVHPRGDPFRGSRSREPARGNVPTLSEKGTHAHPVPVWNRQPLRKGCS